MRPETLHELKKFTPPPKRPAPASAIALGLGGIVLGVLLYTTHIQGDIAEVLDKDPQINEFDRVVSHSGLRDSLSEPAWEYTVIAPMDTAFDRAQWGNRNGKGSYGLPFDSLSFGSGALFSSTQGNPISPGYTGISAYDYVVSLPIYPAEIPMGAQIRVPSLSGQDIVFSRVTAGAGGVRINGHPVRTVRHADNGIIYLIEEVLVFPELEQEYTQLR